VEQEQQEALHQRDEQKKELQKCLRRAIKGNEQKVLRDWLVKLTTAASFQPGRSAETVAFAEGKRAIASFILHEGGFYE